MSFQTCMTFFVLLDTHKKNILLRTLGLEYWFCNDMRLSKWWQNVHVWVNSPLKEWRWWPLHYFEWSSMSVFNTWYVLSHSLQLLVQLCDCSASWERMTCPLDKTLTFHKRRQSREQNECWKRLLSGSERTEKFTKPKIWKKQDCFMFSFCMTAHGTRLMWNYVNIELLKCLFS